MHASNATFSFDPELLALLTSQAETPSGFGVGVDSAQFAFCKARVQTNLEFYGRMLIALCQA
jgi:hypothetical protein